MCCCPSQNLKLREVAQLKPKNETIKNPDNVLSHVPKEIHYYIKMDWNEYTSM